MTLNLTPELRRLAQECHDACCVCGRSFEKDETTHLGYTEDHSPLYVGDCCASLLHETAVRHRFLPRPYQIPENGAQLWRYMDFTKFVSLLSTRALYFCRADRFSDPFEGAKGAVSRKTIWDTFYLEFLQNAIRNPPPGYPCTQSDEEIERDAQRLLEDMESNRQSDRLSTFINCWHENECESDAMWRLYSVSMSQAIAITTTYQDLRTALDRSPEIAIGRVSYIDFTTSFASIYDAFWRKNRSFEHEKEVRAIIHDHTSTKVEGKLVPCNLDILLSAVYLSPRSPVWLNELVHDVMQKYSVDKPVRQSSLSVLPFY